MAERITDHTPILRPSDVTGMRIPGEPMAGRILVQALNGAPCHVCGRPVDEHGPPVRYEDDNGKPLTA